MDKETKAVLTALIRIYNSKLLSCNLSDEVIAVYEEFITHIELIISALEGAY